MKQIIPVLLLFIVGLQSVQAQSGENSLVNWYTIEEAEKLARKEPKKIMIDVYTDWCGWCKKMDKETFNHPVVADYINENYYAVKLNAESKEDITFMGHTFKYVSQNGRGYNELAAGLLSGRLSYPSVAYLNEKLELLGAIPGYKTPSSMESLLNFIAEDKYLVQSLEDYEKTFKSKIPSE